jgi:HSP20 family protein
MTRNLQTWRPIHDLWDLEDLHNFFLGRGRRGRGQEEEGNLSTWTPLVDICEDQEAVRITAELPGMQQKDVKLSVKDGVLTIRGEREFKDEQKKNDYYRIERSYGTFARSFTLPTQVDAEKIHANMKDGVLEVMIPKKEEAKPKEIEIKVN